jgi:hypothetical protein
MTRSIPQPEILALFCANLSALPSAAACAGPPETRFPSALVITARLGESARLRAEPRALTESLAALAARLECGPLASFDLQPLATRLECGPRASVELRPFAARLECRPRASVELWPRAARLKCRPRASIELRPLAARLECRPRATIEPRPLAARLECRPRASIELWPRAAWLKRLALSALKVAFFAFRPLEPAKSWSVEFRPLKRRRPGPRPPAKRLLAFASPAKP